MIYVAHCAGPALVQLRTGVGARLKLWKSSTGRTFWAASSDAVKTELMEELEQLPIDECRDAVAQLTAAEREFQQYGFCTSLSAWRMGGNAVGCPIGKASFRARVCQNVSISGSAVVLKK